MDRFQSSLVPYNNDPVAITRQTLKSGIIRYNPRRQNRTTPAGIWIDSSKAGESAMRFINDPHFWSTKTKIALLAFISFMAMC